MAVGLAVPPFMAQDSVLSTALSIFHCMTRRTLKLASTSLRWSDDSCSGWSPWMDLRVRPAELRAHCLETGQTFQWRKVSSNTEPESWLGVLNGCPLGIRSLDSTTLWRTRVSARSNKRACSTVDDYGNTEAILRDYFQLDTPLAPLYNSWGKADPRTHSIVQRIRGIRVLRQDPVECLISFICSSNNNIARITLMLLKLRERFGQHVADVNFEDSTNISLYSFPMLDELACATEEDLRGLGFGYRAKFVVLTVKDLKEKGGHKWLEGLRKYANPMEVQSLLCSFNGVGRKVADCVALFSLDKTGAIPVDTHVWRIAQRDFDSTLLDAKSITPTIYNHVGDLFCSRYGSHAGWAHSVLFCAELPRFAPMLEQSMVDEMAAFRRQEKKIKAAAVAKRRGGSGIDDTSSFGAGKSEHVKPITTTSSTQQHHRPTVKRAKKHMDSLKSCDIKVI
eukprot:19779_1